MPEELGFIAGLLQDDPLVADLANRMGAYLRHGLATSRESLVIFEGGKVPLSARGTREG